MFYAATIAAVVLDLVSLNRKCFPKRNPAQKIALIMKVNMAKDLGRYLITCPLYCLFTRDVDNCVSKTTG